MLTIYGIKNCDTVRKARAWLATRGIEYQFHDFRTDGLTDQLVSKWISQVGWVTLVNKRSTSWRLLDDTIRKKLSDTNIVSVLTQNPTLIKRPVVTLGEAIIIGFKEDEFITVVASL
ncbi:MAG: ArsC family reductase [Candidatus Azotimanducaceae bacterium]|uniref:ArsC family reductase n=1 Tax=OM182 bacterium TaxID=2510334 RepID=A0A520S5Q8_9GAMM|nr:ArsC family reductase [Gammaproteobacteria bacterium]OUV68468.1 MAG: ArsC family reductase [Gammaproteobacteria bacterium TMED133]RZO77825.1 MAG: ArsC family reductase [OM182 bacterium]